MNLSHIIVSQFKNIEYADLRFSPGINVLYGNNGEGKTNLLDAIHYLSVCKTALGHTDKESIRKEEDREQSAVEAAIFGEYEMDSLPPVKVAVQLKPEGKTVRCNGKAYEKLSAHIGQIPIVLVAPSDTSIIYGSGQERRRFMNFLLSQTDAGYLQRVQDYQRVLLQRNHLLKDGGDVSLLEVLDDRLESRAEDIFKSRTELCSLIRPIVQQYYTRLSGGRETVDVVYQSDLQQAPMKDLLQMYAQRDRLLGFTSTGVQRDELMLYLNGRPLKTQASQGQQKTFLLSVKLAQFSLLQQQKRISPLLLLDDVFDKLDMQRVETLLGVVTGENFGQIFITDSNKTRVSNLVNRLAREHSYFEVEKGKFTQNEA